MKKEELTKLYTSIVNFYGYVYSNEFLMLLGHYGISYDLDEIIKDLKSRIKKYPNEYRVLPIEDYYVIFNPMYSDEEFEALRDSKYNKGLYYPDTLEDLLKYEDINYQDENDLAAIKTLTDYLRSHTKESDSKIEWQVKFILDILKNSFYNSGIQSVFNYFELYNFKLPEEYTNEFVDLLTDVSKNIRMPINNGYTLNEIIEIYGPIDTNDVVYAIDPKMKEEFLNGTKDPYEYLKKLAESNIPPLMKYKFAKEAQFIIKEIKKNIDA